MLVLYFKFGNEYLTPNIYYVQSVLFVEETRVPVVNHRPTFIIKLILSTLQ